MRAAVEHRTPRPAGHLPAVVRCQAAYVRAALHQVSHRLTGHVVDFQRDTVSTSPRVLCRLLDVPDGGVIGVDPPYPQGVPLVLRRQGDSVQAWLNICPQDGRRMNWAPGLFHVKDGTLRCAVRGAQFALDRDGICTSGPCLGKSLIPVPVRAQDGFVTIQ